jgi:hypothetical protein
MSVEGLGLSACGGSDGVIDGFAAGAQLDDAFLCEGDDGVLGVVVLLHAQRLSMSGLVDALQLALETLQLFGVLVVLIAARAGEFVTEVLQPLGSE